MLSLLGVWNITGVKICWPTMDWCTVWNKKDCSDLNENGFSWIVNRFQFQALVPFSGFYSSIFLPHDPEIWLYIIITNAKMQTLMLLGNLFVVGSVCDDLWCNIARWSNSFFHSHFIINSTGLGKQRDIMDIRDRHGSKQFEQFKETGSKNCKLGTIPKSIRTARSPWRTTFSAFTSLVTLSKTRFWSFKESSCRTYLGEAFVSQTSRQPVRISQTWIGENSANDSTEWRPRFGQVSLWAILLACLGDRECHRTKKTTQNRIETGALWFEIICNQTPHLAYFQYEAPFFHRLSDEEQIDQCREQAHHDLHSILLLDCLSIWERHDCACRPWCHWARDNVRDQIKPRQSSMCKVVYILVLKNNKIKYWNDCFLTISEKIVIYTKKSACRKLIKR